MRLIMFSLAAMTASAACLALVFLYALVVPTRPAPAIAIVGAVDASWTGGPVEEPRVSLAADSRSLPN